jgi:hypothetical protein
MAFPSDRRENSSKLHGGKGGGKSSVELHRKEPPMPFPFDATLKDIIHEHTADYEAALGLTGDRRGCR